MIARDIILLLYCIIYWATRRTQWGGWICGSYCRRRGQNSSSERRSKGWNLKSADDDIERVGPFLQTLFLSRRPFHQETSHPTGSSPQGRRHRSSERPPLPILLFRAGEGGCLCEWNWNCRVAHPTTKHVGLLVVATRLL